MHPHPNYPNSAAAAAAAPSFAKGDVVTEHDFAVGVDDGIVLSICFILVDEVKIVAEDVDDRNHVIGDGDAE